MIFSGGLCDRMGITPLDARPVDAAEWRLRVVFGAQLREPRRRLAVEPGNQVQHGVDAGCAASSSQELAIVEPAFPSVCDAEAFKVLGVRPVNRGTSAIE